MTVGPARSLGEGSQRPAKAPNRILWNHGRDTVDEIVVRDCMVHLEQMDTGVYWIGIYTADGLRCDVDLLARCRPCRLSVTVRDEDMVWDVDEEHR